MLSHSPHTNSIIDTIILLNFFIKPLRMFQEIFIYKLVLILSSYKYKLWL